VLVVVFCVLVVVVNVLCAFMVVVLANDVKRWLVINVELKRLKIVAQVANLLKEMTEAGGFLSGIDESDILSLSGGGSDKALAVGLERDHAANHLEDVDSRRFVLNVVTKGRVAVAS
jgi:hypothetical protein